MESGILYIVATPIGNLDDISTRARLVLSKVNHIAAEDTRHSLPLLRHFGITQPVLSYHDHNERSRTKQLLDFLLRGESIALISDAGTPLISDPGFELVRQARHRGIPVRAVPGPCALVAALSVSGLASDRFIFEGFLPTKRGARLKHLESLQDEPRTLIFYESSHRILACLQDMVTVFGEQRQAVIAREITKVYETVINAPLIELYDTCHGDPNQQKGEFVVLVSGAEKNVGKELTEEQQRLMELLTDELPTKKAAALAAKITGQSKNLYYKWAIERNTN